MAHQSCHFACQPGSGTECFRLWRPRRPSPIRTRARSTSKRPTSARRRSATTASSATARCRAAVTRRAPSSGCACRGSTHPASSAASSAGTPGRSGSRPDDVTVPADVRYLPGTMILETSWGTPTGWIIVRDALLIGPWRHEDDRSKTHRRTPNDYDAEHILLRTIRCASGEVQTIDRLRAGLRLRPAHGHLGPTPTHGYHQGVATRRRARTSKLTLTSDLRLGFEGGRASARTLLKEGDVRFVALSWGSERAAADLRGGVPAAGLDRPPLAALAGPRQVPRPSVARLPAAQRADPQGPDLRADRRDRRGRLDLAAGDPGRRAQLRLPLHLDPGRHVRPVGAVLARLRLGGGRLLLLHRRHRQPR